jgi:ParB family chromosome partitioning protein
VQEDNTMSDRPTPVHDLAVTHVPIGSVTPHPRNARRGDVEAIVDSMEENGVFAPIVVQRSTGHIIDGNHRWLAMKQRGEDTAPVVFVDVDDEQALRILLAANRTNDVATYDDAALVELLTSLPDLDGTGFDTDDLADLLEKLEEGAPGSADFAEVPEDDNYAPQYAVTVVCKDEAHQEQVFEKLTQLGYNVKVVAV